MLFSNSNTVNSECLWCFHNYKKLWYFSNINPCILNFESIICMQHFLNSLQSISHVCPVFNNTNNICMQKITEFTVIFNFCFPQSVIALHCYFAVICFFDIHHLGKVSKQNVLQSLSYNFLYHSTYYFNLHHF